MQKPEKQIPIPIPATAPNIRKLKWEKALPKKYFIATVEQSLTSLKLKVEIETIDTSEQKSITCLVDSGTTSEFIDQDYAKSCRFNLVKLKQHIPAYNIDGTPNEAGSIAEVVHLILHHKNHSEWTTFTVTGLRKQKLLLGHSWLRNHNPEIDWVKGEVKMSRCPPCCSRCWNELHQKRIIRKAEAQRMDIFSAGSLLEIDHDSNDSVDPSQESESLSMEEGDHIFATGLLPYPLMDIRASSTISQRLAEAHQANMEALNLVPEYLKEFTSVFSKQSFDTLPEPKEWDHMVELKLVVVSHDSVKMDPIKVAGVMEWLIPTNKKEVQSFLGFTNFY